MTYNQSNSTDNFFVMLFACTKILPTLRDKVAADLGVIRIKNSQNRENMIQINVDSMLRPAS